MNPEYKLIAIDLDGTLLDDQKNIPEKNIEAIRRAVSQGVHVMLATGRPYRAAQWVFERLGIGEGLILSQAGGLVSTYPECKTVYSGRHDPAFIRELAEFCEEHQFFFHCMAISDYYFLHDGPMADLTARYFGYRGIETTLETMLQMNFGKANVITPAEITPNAAKLLKERFGGRVEIAVSDACVTDLTPLGVDKASALLAAAEALGVRQEEIIAIGDTDNDTPMIRTAGLGVCMANGVEGAKAAADYIAPSNNEAGVANVIEKFILDRR